MILPVGLTSLFQSPFVQGAGAVSIGGALIGKVKEAPSKLVALVLNKKLQKVIIYKDEARTFFYEILDTIKQSVHKQVRQTLTTCFMDDDNNLKVNFRANDSTYRMKYKGKKLKITMIAPSSNNNGSGANTNSATSSKQQPIGIEFSSYFLTHADIEEFIHEATINYNKKQNNQIPLSKFGSDYWFVYAKTNKRPIDTLIFNDTSINTTIISDVKKFLDNKQWYDDRYIPHRRGYLLYGEPGNGKTSLIRAIASELNMGIACLNLKSISTDDQLNLMFETIPDNVIVSIEDIDAMFSSSSNNILAERTAKKNISEESNATTKITDVFGAGITFSGLLNALDGLKTCNNRIIFMTTNHKNILDKALLRPGRCDMQLYIGNPNKMAIARLFDLFFPKATSYERREFVDQFEDGKICMAEIQEKLMSHKIDSLHLIETFSKDIVNV